MTARAASPGRPSALRLLAALTPHYTISFFRTPIAAFFTLAFPLILLVIVAAVTGNAVVDTRSGVRVAQFITPMFAVFGVVEACFSALAIYAALQRERGVVKRMRGTPLPPWADVAARIGAAGVVSIAVMVLITGTGVAVHQVRIVCSPTGSAVSCGTRCREPAHALSRAPFSPGFIQGTGGPGPAAARRPALRQGAGAGNREAAQWVQAAGGSLDGQAMRWHSSW